MSQITAHNNQALVLALREAVQSHSDVKKKPLLLDVVPPAPSRLRVYMYSLVSGGESRPNEFKIVLRLPKQKVGQYGSFDYSDGRLAIVARYHPALNVFVFWDALLHPRFMQAGNMQVHRSIVFQAIGNGRADQLRRLSDGSFERVIVCRPAQVFEALVDRLALPLNIGSEYE